MSIFKEILPWIFTVIIIIAFGYFLNNFMEKQNESMKNMQIQMAQITNQKQFLVDKDGTLQKNSLKKLETIENEFRKNVEENKIVEQKINIPLEVLKEVKGFNEALNQRQNETLQLILYVVAFISIIATFFGYKTIRDIKDTADNETKKITSQYEQTFKLLNDITKMYKDDISTQTKDLLNLKDELIKLKITNEQSIQKIDSSAQFFSDTQASYSKQFESFTSVLNHLEQQTNQNNALINQLMQTVQELEGKLNDK